MKVVAIKRGFDGQVVREVGEVFDFEGELGSWMKHADMKKSDEKKQDLKAEKPKADAKKSSDDVI